MDALLAALQDVCGQLLPILGAVALVFLCIALKRLAECIQAITNKVNALDPTIHKVEESLTKVQAPLDTVVKYSHSLDSVHDKTSETIEKLTEAAQEGIAKFQNKADEFVVEEVQKEAATKQTAQEKTEDK